MSDPLQEPVDEFHRTGDGSGDPGMTAGAPFHPPAALTDTRCAASGFSAVAVRLRGAVRRVGSVCENTRRDKELLVS